ncbi:helicase-associated domain-containing protein [Bacillus sp. EB01]|uniref:helicase-associated domain-containing protein n=1 Tax=Bacillus sp. EB01 TaxID=1347086 RepID=UPI0005C624DF|nr:helicase-associated domain-containing protein [Bacillus sp. EB01]
MYDKPLIVHPNSRNIYVVEDLDITGEVSQQLVQFADLKQAPEQVHTYTISPYTLWTAKAKGMEADEIVSFLETNSQNKIPDWFKSTIQKDINQFGSLKFSVRGDDLILTGSTEEIIKDIKGLEEITNKGYVEVNTTTLMFKLRYRREIKKILFDMDYFVKDAVYQSGEEIDIHLLEGNLADYQTEAITSYMKYNEQAGGGGTIIMPPNSGKILAGLKIMENLKTSTLIIVEDKQRMDKWHQEIMDRTDVHEGNISLFENSEAAIKPITIGTYDTISANVEKMTGFGFVIYDDAHKLPTPTHEVTTEIHSKNKLALASTLARADGGGNLVFALIGPKWYEVLHRTLVHKKYQVPVNCVEIKIPLPTDERREYERRNPNNKYNPDSSNSYKREAASIILQKKKSKRALLVTYYSPLIKKYADSFGLPLLSSHLNDEERKPLIETFNNQEVNKLVTASKLIENMQLKAIDTMISLSYHQGSEREEYLRLGKLLPADGGKKEACYYALVSRNTEEEKFYSKRRREMINYGFVYKIRTFEELVERGEFFES